MVPDVALASMDPKGNQEVPVAKIVTPGRTSANSLRTDVKMPTLQKIARKRRSLLSYLDRNGTSRY